MGWTEKPSVLRRGAAPPDQRTSAIFIAVSCLLHVALLAFFVTKASRIQDIALPASGGPSPKTRAQLVRLTPLRSFPNAEASAPAAEPERERPKPALIKRYTPGAKVVVRPERGAAKKSAADETKSPPKTVTAAPQADTSPRWYSADSTKSTSVATEGDFRWAYYLAAIRNKIGSRWVPPPGMEGKLVKATVYFRIHKDGQISLTSVETSSGYAFFDQTAMRALLAATPLPPLPAGYTDDYLGVHFGFEYQQ
ncbi:MAG TPA: energy transducer TonB [Candidatus Eisenbacteria bacterium]|nr:energy transducer TonB [Candidatus Eisenbacteria bacterium]